jgi:hypothetical protein
MSGPRVQPCTLAAKHKWEWSRDVTMRTVRDTLHGTQVALSRRGWYGCACGAKRLGAARSGL